MVTSEKLWETYQRDQRITNRIRNLYHSHRAQHGTTVRDICDYLRCSTSCFYSHLNGTTPRNQQRMANLVSFLGGDPVEVLEDENAVQYLPAANEETHPGATHDYYTNGDAAEVDRLCRTLTHRQVVELVIAKAPYMKNEDLSYIVRELIEVGWNAGTRPLEVPF